MEKTKILMMVIGTKVLKYMYSIESNLFTTSL